MSDQTGPPLDVPAPHTQDRADEGTGIQGAGVQGTGVQGTGIQGTGIEGVDEVVDSLGTLDGVPVAEHVAVFERAHASLRHALSDASRD